MLSFRGRATKPSWQGACDKPDLASLGGASELLLDADPTVQNTAAMGPHVGNLGNPGKIYLG